ncbi:Oidioi.mRNA.OKI2018_I69.PAR.g12276.t1.cds [Oikopleura dioica]|uniref:Tetratricopeptide repeat protein 29 n=1 Tax=Oikopleura dioica TaxID=34765 RepID=A0ABN7S372_OIKDI|nr:Oidioi.mRNA.OKI2018_I69.PAR.g12276.t1.cds [Oikopleura dioica]
MPTEFKLKSLAPGPPSGTILQLQGKLSSVNQETLSHSSTCYKRNDYYHNTCIEMLRNGYHKAYSEMFNLIEKRKLEIIAAGPGTLMSLAPVVHENKEYLDTFKEKLTAAEEAERKSEQVKVYSNISELALYFSERKLTWLSHHFFDRALAIASEITVDSGKSLCEASERCGLACESRGEIDASRSHLEKAVSLSHGRGTWKTAQGDTWNQTSSFHLSRVLRLVAEKDSSIESQLQLLEKSVLAADTSKYEKTISTANYHYGHKLFQAKMYKNHVKFLNAASKTPLLYRMGGQCSVDALSQMSLLYNAYKKHPQATELIQKAYHNCEEAKNRERSTRVAVGTVVGNEHLLEYRRQLSLATKNKKNVRILVNWKNLGDLQTLQPDKQQN